VADIVRVSMKGTLSEGNIWGRHPHSRDHARHRSGRHHVAMTSKPMDWACHLGAVILPSSCGRKLVS
jgi:hypothetical protein